MEVKGGRRDPAWRRRQTQRPAVIHPPPSSQLSERDPTIRIHYDYERYKNQRDVRSILTITDQCSRDNFYLLLLVAPPRIMTEMVQMFDTCATPGPPGEKPVDDAIRAYSTLIINYFNAGTTESISKANYVVKFLKTDYARVISRSEEYSDEYIEKRHRIRLLFMEDLLLHGSFQHSQAIYDDIIDHLVELFVIPDFYIEEKSQVVKRLIINLLLKGVEPIVEVYRTIDPLIKAHFFAFILNMQEFIDDDIRRIPELMRPAADQMYAEIQAEIHFELSNVKSGLNLLLQRTNNYSIASQITQQFRAPPAPAVPPPPPAAPVDTGGKKRTLRNNNSKSYSKKTKNKNKNNKKTRRSRFSKK